jgi:CTP synthase
MLASKNMVLNSNIKNKKINFIFITGGVVSSLGKGLLNASLGRILLSQGYKLKFVKCDPYLNVDPGTMNPNQHGEVYVLKDGGETDLDFGHYERFTDLYMKKNSSITAGKIYSSIFKKEREGVFLGQTVQTIPHVTNEIKSAIYSVADEDTDFILCEIGGTVGDIEALPFLEAIRQIGFESKNAMYIHMTFVPFLKSAGELKTKPTQHSINTLRSLGIQPNVLICRAEDKVPIEHRAKIASFSNLTTREVIPLIDTKNVYDIPLSIKENDLDKIICEHFELPEIKDDYLKIWCETVERMNNCSKKSKICIVGKYTDVDDSYKSLVEAIRHAGFHNDCKVEIKVVDAKELDRSNSKKILSEFNGVVIAGGFGINGIEGKIEAIRFARENNMPMLGICMGMQLALVEAARNLLNLEDANSTEIKQDCEHPIVCKMEEWTRDGKKEFRMNETNLGGTMRLGSYDCYLKDGSLAKKIYGGKEVVSERHRHRYEFNNNYKERLESVGIVFSGSSFDDGLAEMIEIPSHPWFVATQFHPELQSTVLNPNPLFNDFVRYVSKHSFMDNSEFIESYKKKEKN